LEPLLGTTIQIPAPFAGKPIYCAGSNPQSAARASKSFVVIELKKGRPSDQVVGQILRYMGWVKRNLCKDGQSVKGLVICHDSDPKLSYALEMAKDIDIRYYSVSFKLTDAL
jgi:hypothetical protein